jgi:hypothetical protein
MRRRERGTVTVEHVRARRILGRVVVGVIVLANFFFLVPTLIALFGNPEPYDWRVLREASADVLSGNDPFEGAYLWSPIWAVLFAPFAWAGLWAWRILHVAALLMLPTWRIRLLTLASFPFWFDVVLGNTMTFIAVTAVWAMRGSRVGAAAYLWLFLLIPRPLLLPVAVWLLTIHRRWIVPFVLAGLGQVLVLAHVGLFEPWLRKLMTTASTEVGTAINFAPSAFIGLAWFPIGVALGVLAFTRGRVGLASILASPYWLPYYFLMGLVDLAERRRAPYGWRSLRPRKEHVTTSQPAMRGS